MQIHVFQSFLGGEKVNRRSDHRGFPSGAYMKIIKKGKRGKRKK